MLSDTSILISKVGWKQDEASEKAIWMALESKMEMEPEYLLSRCATVKGKVELISPGLSSSTRRKMTISVPVSSELFN